MNQPEVQSAQSFAIHSVQVTDRILLESLPDDPNCRRVQRLPGVFELLWGEPPVGELRAGLIQRLCFWRQLRQLRRVTNTRDGCDSHMKSLQMQVADQENCGLGCCTALATLALSPTWTADHFESASFVSCAWRSGAGSPLCFFDGLDDYHPDFSSILSAVVSPRTLDCRHMSCA